jgi:hypothetical protein
MRVGMWPGGAGVWEQGSPQPAGLEPLSGTRGLPKAFLLKKPDQVKSNVYLEVLDYSYTSTSPTLNPNNSISPLLNSTVAPVYPGRPSLDCT